MNNMPIQPEQHRPNPRAKPGEHWALAAVGLAVVAVSFAAIFVRWTTAPPAVVAFYRLGLSTLLMLPWAMWERRPVSGRKKPSSSLWGSGTWPGRDLKLCLLGGVFLALHYWLWFSSLRLTSVTSSTVLVTSHPIFVLALSYLLWREVVPWRSFIWLFLALGGVYIIARYDLAGGKDNWVGDVLALISAGCISIYFLVGQVVRQRWSVARYTAMVYGTATVILMVIAWVQGHRLAGYELREYGIYCLMALVPTLLGHNLFNWALPYVGAGVISVSILGEPVGATLLAIPFLGEYPAVPQLAGGAIILTGIYGFLREREKIGTRRQAPDSLRRGSKMGS